MFSQYFGNHLFLRCIRTLHRTVGKPLQLSFCNPVSKNQPSRHVKKILTNDPLFFKKQNRGEETPVIKDLSLRRFAILSQKINPKKSPFLRKFDPRKITVLGKGTDDKGREYKFHIIRPFQIQIAEKPAATLFNPLNFVKNREYPHAT